MRTCVTVNHGNYCGRGAEYVNILFDSIRRNSMHEDTKFICFTDDPTGVDSYIECRALPGNLNGWWNKLYLFSKEANLGNGQVFFFDLDTIILGPIDDYLDYTGPFAILRDFYRPDGYGSGLMSWHGHTGIWEKFVDAGCPDLEGGDQIFIERVQPAARLQDICPGIYSFKQNDCERWPPHDAKIVCFHGTPRPHEVKGNWVELIWKKGGAQAVPPDHMTMNTTLEKVIANMESNVKLDVRWFAPRPAKNKTICIVGGAPSLNNNLGELRKRIQLGAKVMSVNGTLKYLLSKGIKPDYHAQFDARPDNAEFVKDAPEGIIYLIGSMSHPSVFEALKGRQVMMWHGGFDMDEMKRILEPYQYKPIVIIGGGKTITLRAMWIGYYLGFKRIHVLGIDSCFAEKSHHAYSQPLNDRDGYFDVWALGKKYHCAPWMYSQADNFKTVYQMMTEAECDITVHGEGLIPDMWRHFNSLKTKEAV